ncbi:hypothetical protein [Aeromonas hydrophila]|uniref:hypothetical protein n=1 Tax=Aeromonas hydrophila TaxID=644 RepID=UPI002441D7CF|nr:hypothetical protein [Aeromonas hydrophila]
MDSKLRAHALQVAGWGLLYGDFFDLYDVAEAFDISSAQAGQLMLYLRTSDWVDKDVKVRRGLREEGKAPKRIFIKVRCIHQEPAPRLEKVPPTPKWKPIQQQLKMLVKLMPSPKQVR